MKYKYVTIFKYYLNYFIFLLIFKNINILLSVSIEQLNNYFFVFIPISYLIVKYLFIYDLQKHNYRKKEFLWPILIGFTILNFILKMPIFYNIFIIFFILILKCNSIADIDTNKYIQEYYQNKDKNR